MARAETLYESLKALGEPLECAVEPTDSATGGGSLPDAAIPSAAVKVTVSGLSAEELARRLRRNEPPVIAQIRGEQVVLDLRTVLDGEELAIAEAFRRILENVN